MLNRRSADLCDPGHSLTFSEFVSSSVKGERKRRRRTRFLRLLVDGKQHFKYVKYFYYKKSYFYYEKLSINKSRANSTLTLYTLITQIISKIFLHSLHLLLSFLFLLKYFKSKSQRNSLVDPVVSTQIFHCHGPSFKPLWAKIPQAINQSINKANPRLRSFNLSAFQIYL